MANRKPATHHRTGKPVEHFEVLDQIESPQPQSDGSIVDVWTITFRTSEGTIGYVTVPDSDYTAEHVGGLIAVKAAEIDKIDGLGG